MAPRSKLQPGGRGGSGSGGEEARRGTRSLLSAGVLLSVALPVLLPALFSCSGPSRGAGEGKELEARQIQVLRRISRMEARVKARVEALPQVARALVKIRPGKALLLVAPARGSALDPEVVGKIRGIVFEETGLRGKSLVMRRWGNTGGS